MIHKAKGRTICGVGVKGDLPSTTPSYRRWVSMIKRCYDKTNPTYIGCSVIEEWLYYPNFHEWYINNCTNESYALDKDIIETSNKIYGPDTCCFVPPTINNLLTHKKLSNDGLPNGVTKITPNYFQARLRKFGKRVNLGGSSCPHKAGEIYITEKAKHIIEVAKKALEEGEIDARIHDALIKHSTELRKCQVTY